MFLINNKINDKITKTLVEKYLNLTRTARDKISNFENQTNKEKEMVENMLEMADNYISDANHFFQIKDYVRSYGAINYAHAWIDACVKLGLMDGHDDDVLFTLP